MQRSSLSQVLLIAAFGLIAVQIPVSALDKDDPAAAQAALKTGKALYDQKKYPEAQKYLTKAATAGSKNTVAQYYLGLAAAQNGDIQTVKRAMARIIVRNRASSGNAKQASAMLARYANSCEPYCSTNNAGQLVRFLKSDMPIKIYITSGLMLPVPYRGNDISSPTDRMRLVALMKHGDAFTARLEHDPNFSSSLRGSVMQGLQKWDWARSEGLFNYQLVNSANDCDIIVFWCPKLPGNVGGYTSTMNCGTAGKKVVMQVATTDIVGPGPNEISNFKTWVGMHEFGHAWGLSGHSPSENDIMFKAGSYSEEMPALSENDKTTLRAVYDIAPDISL